MRTSIAVEFFYDPESRNWSFTCHEPSIVGGGDRTPERAAHHFARVLADTLRWEEEDCAAERQATGQTVAKAG